MLNPQVMENFTKKAAIWSSLSQDSKRCLGLGAYAYYNALKDTADKVQFEKTVPEVIWNAMEKCEKVPPVTL